MKLVLLMYNVHLYFSLKDLGRISAIHMAKYGSPAFKKITA